MLTQDDLNVLTLGPCEIDSPMLADGRKRFVSDTTRVLRNIEVEDGEPPAPLSYEKAGPRRSIFFDPTTTTAALVTCGGLSPGLNNVIRSAHDELRQNYRVTDILGIRNGYRGLNPAEGDEPIALTDDNVEIIHQIGGTMLGSSRGPQDPAVVVDFLEQRGIDILFPVGGDGTQRGAHAISEELKRRGLPKAIVGIPKTIDNDIAHVFPSFGYATALESAAGVIRSAHVEAKGAPDGIVVVKVMGRNAGFIAAGAAIVNQDADFVLVPEVPFPLDGQGGFLDALERRMLAKRHAVIVVAEGAGQHLFDEGPSKRDKSGNLLHQDIGPFLCDRIKQYFAESRHPVSVRYIDPSYIIRSQPANAWDRFLCDRMARNAVHAAMAGKTDMMIAYRLGRLFHVPIPAVVSERVTMPLDSEIWSAVLALTGQPRW